jgi:tripartite-type tricarboxylate transporter receptor subunit TctC
MTNPMRGIVFSIVAFATAAAFAAVPPGADYPARPVRMVVTFTAGGTPDAIARIVAGQMERQFGQSFVVDNRAGANGIIGTDIVAKAAPDGYTLLHVTGSLVINPRIYRNLPYDVFRDLEPVTNIVLGDGYLLLVHPSVPAQTVRELVALAKNKDKPLSYGTPGIGNTLHLATELFNVRAGTQLLHVPYKGVAPALNSLLAGETQVIFIPPTIAVQHVKTGKARALGFTGSKRWPFMPEVPTIMEAGVPDFEITGSWHGWLAPAHTPRAVIARIHAEAKKALQVPRVREFLVAGGYEPDGSTPEHFRKFLKTESDRYAEAVRAAGIKPE